MYALSGFPTGRQGTDLMAAKRARQKISAVSRPDHSLAGFSDPKASSLSMAAMMAAVGRLPLAKQQAWLFEYNACLDKGGDSKYAAKQAFSQSIDTD